MEAKAYSDIRDAQVQKVSLEGFLTETVGLLGIIPVEKYLQTMGWKVVVHEPAEYHLVKVDPAVGMDEIPLSTNLSAADIVNHCYDIGFVARPSQPGIAVAAAAGIAMAFAANPAGPPTMPKMQIVVEQPELTGTFTDEHDSLGVGAPLS
jgi:Mating-type protein MAT alpha 1 HMG-box